MAEEEAPETDFALPSEQHQQQMITYVMRDFLNESEAGTFHGHRVLKVGICLFLSQLIEGGWEAIHLKAIHRA